MESTNASPPLTARGRSLDLSPARFGFLRVTDAESSPETLRDRLEEDGYLYLKNGLDREAVQTARQTVLTRAAVDGLLDPSEPQEAGILRENVNPYFRPGYAQNNPALHHVLYEGKMLARFEAIFDAPVRHFDYTWLRAVGPGPGTAPHCDVVYMGRGTQELLTAWTPLGDIPLRVGGLIILQNSHRRSPEVLGDYLRQDVDSYCENGPNREAIRSGKLNWEHWNGSFEAWDGAITHDPVELRKQLGGRWLTSPEYHMGDVLIFTMRTVHASIDNQTRFLRLSTDTRYQPATSPVDERWINGVHGEAPIAHGIAGKRGKIC